MDDSVFRYFAYGSNMWPPQLRSRCASARIVGTATLPGWRAVCDKPSNDGSTKLNIRADAGSSVSGVLYEIDDEDRPSLDRAEPRCTAMEVMVSGKPAVTHTYRDEPADGSPYDWYASTVEAGAAHHGITGPRLDPVPDPMARDISPVGLGDIETLQEILSKGLAARTSRYYIHPGELAWWTYHDDPRAPDHFSCWAQGDWAFLTVDSRDPFEINVFSLPGVSRMPLVRWAQRRLDGKGEIGGVADEDEEMVDDLIAEGYQPSHVFRKYEWDLTEPPPEPKLHDGWQLRHLNGEEEADRRRAASHAAFESKMPVEVHLERYLRLMRSPAYDNERDLVVADADGDIAAFMIWWGDPRTGIAQIEPFGTHPRYQRQGLGRALLHHGLGEMRRAGMHLARVSTYDDRPAAAFYEACGFADVGRLRWWRPT